MKTYLELFLTFAKIGILTFGGGYAMIPMLISEVVKKKKWTTEEEFMDYFAVGQCTPGVIAVNTATFIGLKLKGVRGGIAATLGVVFPSILIILLLSAVIDRVSEYSAVRGAFAGIRLAVCGLITVTIIKLIKKSVADLTAALIFTGILAGVVFFGLSPVPAVIIAAGAGIVIKTIAERKKSGKGAGK